MKASLPCVLERSLTAPQFGGVVAEATLDIRMQFIRKVYAIL